MKIIKTLLIALVSFWGLTTFGEVIYASMSDADIQARNDNNPPINVTSEASAQLYAGCAGAVGQDRCVVIPVELPDYGAVAEPFTEQTAFIFNYEGKNSSVIGHVNVYGLGRRSSPQVMSNDYWTATTAVDSTDADLLAESVITANSTSFGLKTINNAALVNYLNTQYDGGAGAGEYVFFRLSTTTRQTGGASRYLITSADAGTLTTLPRIVTNADVPTVAESERPFIWVKDSDKADILTKISTQSWAQGLYDGIVSRVSAEVSSHQSNRDSFIRNLPVIWTANPPVYKTYPAYSEARMGSFDLFNTGVDCALLYYLSGDDKYARCAADLLHNAVKTMLQVTPSTNLGNGGWIFTETSNGLLYEARVMGAQLPIIYDFLHAWLQDNQVYDVTSGGMVDFSFSNAQDAFRTYYELTRDHGNKTSNWSALMATTMLNCLLALDDEAERNAALEVYLTTGTTRQASLDFDYRDYKEPGSIWPESLQYASAVGELRSVHMAILERYDPSLSLFEQYPNLPLSLSRIRDFIYPNESEQISFGDGKRHRQGQPFFEYELIYRHAKDQGYTELASLMGSLISGGISAGEYNRSALMSYSQFGPKNEPLQLLWHEPTITETPAPHVLPRTDKLPFAGITLQRNISPNGNPDYGLMGFVGGADHIHSHACGMAMELYGMGEVMGAKAGRSGSYTETIHTKYYRLFAANNTIIVNGASRGDGGWKGLGMDTVASVAMEPQPFTAAVSSNLSFTCSSFNDNKGDLAEATQQRSLALIRTSDTTGFYVDLFRSKSTVTSRTATTLNGNVTDQYHDYIYRNIGDITMTLESDGENLPLFNQANRFQNDVGDQWDQPGWRYFDNTQVSYPEQSDFFAQFKATPTGKSSIYMDLHMPSIAVREVAKTDAPPITYAPAPYDKRDAPTLVVRQIGDAWDTPFVSVFEPHYSASGGTIEKTTALWSSGKVVGVKVESRVGGSPVIHYVISNPNDNQTYTDSSIGLSFQGRFGIIADYGLGDYELYVGDGRSIEYKGYSITSNSGDTEASMVIRPWQVPVVTANGPVTTTVDPSESPVIYELIAGWDIWSSPTAPVASVLAPNITGTAVTTTEQQSWNTSDERGASNDGDWGHFATVPSPSTVTNANNENLTLSNASSGGTITFTVTNNGTRDIDLNSFHFDAYAFRFKAPRTYELSVLANGGISDGAVFTSAANAISEVSGANANDAHDDIDIDLTGLADVTLGAGESASFLLAFSGGQGDGAGGHHLFVDNVCLSGVISPDIQPPATPVLEHSMNSGNMVFRWTGNGFKIQSRTNLLEGAWQDLPSGDTPPVTNSVIDSECFFRLIEQ